MFSTGPTSSTDPCRLFYPWKKYWSIVEQPFTERIFYFARERGGQVASLAGQPLEMQMSSRTVWAARVMGGVVGGSPLFFPAPLLLLWVDLCWKWSQVGSARASSTLTEISRGEKLWQHQSVGGRWRDCASLWVEDEAKHEWERTKS